MCVLCFGVVVCVCGVCVWCVVCVVQMIYNTASLSWRVRTMHLIGRQNTWEQAPGVPANPFPALMAGVNPGRVPVHTALKSTRRRAMSSTCPRDNANCGTPTVSALSRPAHAPVVAQQQACERQCPASAALSGAGDGVDKGPSW